MLKWMTSGVPVRSSEPRWAKMMTIVGRTQEQSVKLNTATNVDDVRRYLSVIIGTPIDEKTAVFPPFYTNFGRFIKIGKNVFINHACSFLDLGGITIEDDVMIGPKVNLITENHPIDPTDRKALLCKPIMIRRNAWLGAGSTILPGVTIGNNSIVAAGAVVSKDVPPNTVVGGIPARILKKFDGSPSPPVTSSIRPVSTDDVPPVATIPPNETLPTKISSPSSIMHLSLQLPLVVVLLIVAVVLAKLM
jgi:acetyltransferase-like isoleucine patch superfamily enzyme